MRRRQEEVRVGEAGGRGLGRGQLRIAEERPKLAGPRTRYTYLPGTSAVPGTAAAYLMNRSFVISADVDVPAAGAEGVLLCHGGNTGGYSLFVREGLLSYAYNYVGAQEFRIEAGRAVSPGRHELRLEFERTGEPDLLSGRGAGGRGRLYIDRELVGEGEIPVTVPIMFGAGGGLVCGRSSANPITDAYEPPFPFTGTIHAVVVEVGREALTRHHEAELRAAMAHQ